MLAKYPSTSRRFIPKEIRIHDGYVKCGGDMKCMNSINRVKVPNAECLLVSNHSEKSHNLKKSRE